MEPVFSRINAQNTPAKNTGITATKLKVIEKIGMTEIRWYSV